MSHTPSRVRTMASEFVVIVLGVLVALGLESAWQDRQDRIREASLIQDLALEFGRNRDLLVRDLDRNRGHWASAEEWRRAESSTAPLSADSASALMRASITLFRYDPEDGALRSVLQTGGLELVESDDLRSALSGWPGRVAEARQTAMDGVNARHVLMSELYDTVEGTGSARRRQLVLETHAVARRNVVSQQEELLIELDRILSLLAEAS